jgi:23S rRNA (guanosine2251-2'-O)-methyltransferase
MRPQKGQRPPPRNGPPPRKGGGSPHQKSKEIHGDIPRDARIIVGNHAIEELLKTRPEDLLQMWVKNDWRRDQQLREWAEKMRNPDRLIQQKGEAALDRYGNHQGAVAFAKNLDPWGMEELAAKETATVLFLDGMNDPHNLGAILRTAWLMKVDGVVLSADRSVGLTPTVHKVACGGVEHVPTLQVSQLSQIAERLQEIGFWIFGLSHKSSEHIYGKSLPKKVVWVIGSEEKGLRSTTESACDELIRIPQLDAAASYNASVAAALALGETARQHRFSRAPNL